MQAPPSEIQPGWTVRDRDGVEIGTIDGVGPGYVLVRKGVILRRDLFVPTEQITEVDPQRAQAQVELTTAEIDELDWDEPPVNTGTELVEDQEAAFADTSPRSHPDPSTR
jgi:hypothetical protein